MGRLVMIEPTFPITLREKDSERQIVCGSVYEIQYHVEKIDVENGEYEAKDAHGRPVRLEVVKPVWVKCTVGMEGNT
jgi:hypothetical protein